MFPSQLSITLVSQRVSVWTVLSKIASYRALRERESTGKGKGRGRGRGEREVDRGKRNTQCARAKTSVRGEREVNVYGTPRILR